LRSISLRWPRSVWLFEENGFSAEIQNLTRQYRNPAAHTTLLTEDDYRSCAKLVQGADGILWRLLAAIDPTKR
jgi:hypothetical protein